MRCNEFEHHFACRDFTSFHFPFLSVRWPRRTTDRPLGGSSTSGATAIDTSFALIGTGHAHVQPDLAGAGQRIDHRVGAPLNSPTVLALLSGRPTWAATSGHSNLGPET